MSHPVYLMGFDLEKILASKRAFRQRLPGRATLEEKLSMLDALRERTLALRPLPPASKSGALHEEPPPYRPGKEIGRKANTNDAAPSTLNHELSTSSARLGE